MDLLFLVLKALAAELLHRARELHAPVAHREVGVLFLKPGALRGRSLPDLVLEKVLLRRDGAARIEGPCGRNHRARTRKVELVRKAHGARYGVFAARQHVSELLHARRKLSIEVKVLPSFDLHRRNVHLGARERFGAFGRMARAFDFRSVCAEDVGALMKARAGGFEGKGVGRRRSAGTQKCADGKYERKRAERYGHGMEGKRVSGFASRCSERQGF